MKKLTLALLLTACVVFNLSASVDSTATSALAPVAGTNTVAIIGTVSLALLSFAEVILRLIPTKDNNAPVARILQFLNAVSEFLNREKKTN